MARSPIMKVKLNYRFDAYLLHLIQETTKKQSAEILNFFNELSKRVCEIGAEKRTGQGIRKNIKEYYPGTSIPFHMLAVGHPSSRRWDPITKGYVVQEEVMSCSVEIGFPEQKEYIKSQDLDDIAIALMEQALMDGEEIQRPPFIKPEIHTPRMYKDLMDAFAGRPVEEKEEKQRKPRKPRAR